jgi:O-antigen/teichoic acid export membrane protein
VTGTAPYVRRIVTGVYANVYGRAVILLTQVAGVPVLLHFWGTALYGEWLMLFAIPLFLSMTDLGFSHSAANDMTQRVAQGDIASALRVFQTLYLLVFASAAVVIFIVTSLILLAPDAAFAGLDHISPSAARWILWLLAGEVLLKLFDGVIQAGFRASRGYTFHTVIYYTTMLAQQSSVWVVAYLGFGPVTAAAVFLSVRAVATPVTALLLRHRHPWLDFRVRYASKSELARLAKPALANLALPLAQALNVQGFVLLVGALLGPFVLVVFATLRTMTRLVLQSILGLLNAAEPELAAVYGTGDRALLSRMYTNIARTSFWCALGLCIALGITGHWILAIWTHEHVAMDDRLFAWLLVSALVGCLWYGALILLKSANRHLGAAYLYAGLAAASILLAYVGIVATDHVEAAGVALLALDLAMAAYTVRAAASLCFARPLDFVLAAVNPTPLFFLALRRLRAR